MAIKGKPSENRKKIFDRVKILLEPWIDDISVTDEINEETNMLSELGIDSVGVLQLILGIEQEYGIRINDYELDSEFLSRIGNIINMIENRTHEDN